MLLKKTILILACLKSACIFAQTDVKYKVIDSLLRTESITDAMTVLEKLRNAPAKDTSDAAYWLRFSKAFYATYSYSDAATALDKAIALKPQQSQYYFEKGLLLNKLNNLESSLVSLERAVALKPEGEYYYWKGIVNQRLKYGLAAQQDYSNAVKKGFSTPELYTNYAILLVEEKRLPEALIQVNHTIALNKQDPSAYSVRSKIHLYLFHVDSACRDAAEAISLGHKRAFEIPDSVCNGNAIIKGRFVGDVCATVGLDSQAIQAYSKAIDAGTDDANVYLNRGYCSYRIKDYKQAEKDYLQALTLPNADRDLLYDDLGVLYFDQSDYLHSIEYSTKRIMLNPKNPVSYIDRGLGFRKLKNYKDAEKDFNTALSIKPDFQRAFGYRAYLFMELGQLQKAYNDADKAIDIDSTYGYAYLVRAQVKYSLGIADYCIDLYQAKKYGEPAAEPIIRSQCK